MSPVEDQSLDIPVCAVDGCEKSSVKRGMCGAHYHRDWKERTQAPIPHGTINAYNNRGCRCKKCKAAISLVKRAQYLARKEAERDAR